MALKSGILQQRCSFILFSIITIFLLKPTLCLCSVTIFTAGAASQVLDDSCGEGRRKTFFGKYVTAVRVYPIGSGKYCNDISSKSLSLKVKSI